MIPAVMQSVGAIIEECGSRLAPFERRRVGRAGCVTALVAMAAALGGLALGWREVAGAAAGFRFVVVCGLAAVIVLFIGYAVIETLVERAVWRRLEAFVREGGTDLEMLRKAAEMRGAHVKGGARLVALIRSRAGTGR